MPDESGTRAPPEALWPQRAARAAAGAFNEQIGARQPKVAELAEIVARGTPTDRQSLGAAAESIAEEIHNLRIRFDQTLSAIPNYVQQKDQIADTRKAIVALVVMADDLRATFRRPVE